MGFQRYHRRLALAVLLAGALEAPLFLHSAAPHHCQPRARQEGGRQNTRGNEDARAADGSEGKASNWFCCDTRAIFAATLGSILILGHAAAATAKFMDCGAAPLCGVLTLETGLGQGPYKQEKPVVHGLWPQVGKYGSSKCIRPKSSEANPTQIYSCYSGGKLNAQLGFEKHEWEDHGTCAGVKDAEEYFQEVCTLSQKPLALMAAERAAGNADLNGFAKRLDAAGYPVYATDAQNMQVELSACANEDGQWLLAKPSDFGTRCAGKAATMTQAKAAASTKVVASTVPLELDKLQCKLNQKGPACKTDADCGYSGCVRCAKSGFCTAQSLQ